MFAAVEGKPSKAAGKALKGRKIETGAPAGINATEEKSDAPGACTNA